MRQPKYFIQPHEISLDRSRSHQVNAGEKHAVGVKQRFYPRTVAVHENRPLVVREAEIMMRMVFRDASGRELAQFLMLGRRMDYER
jgi:hypothetical protein